jgi:PAS domain-containing protein
MTNSNHAAVSPRSASPSSVLEEAIDNLLLGILIFDAKREVVFCNKRYMEIYGLSTDQVKPGTPVS